MNRRSLAWVGAAVSAFMLSGCGFVDVSQLSAPVQKEAVLVFAAPSLLGSAAVQTVVQDAPASLSVVELGAPNQIANYAQILRRFHPRWVILDAPSTAIAAMAASDPNTHFFAIAPSATSTTVTSSNWTWIVPDASPLAAVAGYIAGGLAQTGSIVVVGSSPVQSAFLTAVASGAHAAFSRASVVTAAVYGGAGYATPSLSGSVYVRLPSGSTAGIVAPLQTNGAPVINLTGYPSGSATKDIAYLSSGQIFAVGLATALRTVAQGTEASVSQFDPASAVRLRQYTGWPGETGVRTFVSLLTKGTVTPISFAMSVPTAQTAKVIGLPLTPIVAKAKSTQGASGAVGSPLQQSGQPAAAGTGSTAKP